MDDLSQRSCPYVFFSSHDSEHPVLNSISIGKAPTLKSLLLFLKFGFTVDTAVNAIFTIRQFETVRKFLLNGCDTAWILTADDAGHCLRKRQFMFFDNVIILNDIDRDIVIQNTEYI